MVYMEVLKRYRKNSELTQTDLAEKIGVSRNTVYDWERGAYPPTDSKNIAALEDAFGLKRGELYKELQPANPTPTPPSRGREASKEAVNSAGQKSVA